MAAKVGDFVGGEMYIFKELQGLLEPRSYQIIAPRRKVADEELECGAGFKPGLQITRRHRKFIEIG